MKTITATIICSNKVEPENFHGTDKDLIRRMWELSGAEKNTPYQSRKKNNLFTITLPEKNIQCYAVITEEEPWHDVKKELPKETGWYWVYTISGETMLDTFDANFNVFMHTHMLTTYWQPAKIPEPPKGAVTWASPKEP